MSVRCDTKSFCSGGRTITDDSQPGVSTAPAAEAVQCSTSASAATKTALTSLPLEKNLSSFP